LTRAISPGQTGSKQAQDSKNRLSRQTRDWLDRLPRQARDWVDLLPRQTRDSAGRLSRLFGACLLAIGLLARPVLAQPETESSPDAEKPRPNSQGPYPRGIFGSPTGGILREGEDEGFGLGPALSDPHVFEGSARPETVLQGSRYVDNYSLTGRYGIYLAPEQRLMFTATGGYSVAALDLDYSFVPEGCDGFFSVYLAQTRSWTGSFLPGELDVGLKANDQEPWVYRTSTGFSYSSDPSQNLVVSAGLVYQTVSVRDAVFQGNRAPLDRLGNPLTLSANGVDRLLWLRCQGLYTDVNDLQFPTEGHKLRFGLDQAIPVGATSLKATRVSLNYSHFAPVELWGDEPQTLIFNLQAGSILGTVPAYEAFNLGGVHSVRSMGLGEMGGGRSFLQSSLELRVPLGELSLFGQQIPMRFCTFVDYGTALGTAPNVYGQPGVVRQKRDSAWGYGAGFQAVTDLGLVRLEAGFGPQGQSQIQAVVGDRY